MRVLALLLLMTACVASSHAAGAALGNCSEHIPIVVAEGDSISVFGDRNYTGMFAASRHDICFKDVAVGGSGIDSLMSREPALLALKPNYVSIFIGANDLSSAWQYPTTDAWLDALFKYTDIIRATGAKVAVGTVLAQQVASRPHINALLNARRRDANAGIRRAAQSGRIDGVIDFAADPIMGIEAAPLNKELFRDGLHPTDACGSGCGGQGRLETIYAAAMNRLLASQAAERH